MKRITGILMLFFITVSSFPQDLKDTLKGILSHIEENIPADQLFLHLDRNLYHAGDTIRFMAYIRDSQTGLFETKSSSLYALLLNAGNATIDSARFRINYSTASGWLKVPDTAAVGYYTVVAFTSDQMNYDPEFAYATPVRIDKTGLSVCKIKPETRREETVDLRFLPEGGTFICGVKQRLSFNAVNSYGRNVSVSGDIIDRDGNRICEFRSGAYGPGILEFTPVSGESYYAIPAEGEFRNLRWPLPRAEKSGICIRVNSAQPGLIDIKIMGNEKPGKTYFLAVTMNNILLFSREISSDTVFSARINTDGIPAGTAFVTIYDNELNPVAERLIFINENKKMNVQIGVSEQAASGRENELTINTTDEHGNNTASIISVSIIDSLSGFSSGIPLPDIESVFLYDNGFYNNLPHDIRYKGLRNIDEASFDLLLMTYGWRKYTLKETAFLYQGKRSENYDYLRISNPGDKKRVRQEIRLLSPEGGSLITLEPDTGMAAILPFDSLQPFIRQVIILPDDKSSQNNYPMKVEFPADNYYTEKTKLIKCDPPYLSSENAILKNEIPLFNPDSAIVIEPVVIKGHKKEPGKYVDRTAHEFQYSGAYTLYSKDFVKSNTFEDILYKLNPYKIDKRLKRVIIRPQLYFDGPPLALFVLDGMQLANKDYMPIADMPASEIASITILRGPQGFARYGDQASRGVIVVTTKVGNRINGGIDPEEDSLHSDNNLQIVRLFRTETEYYIPTKEDVNVNPEFQFRSTILWKDNLYLDGSGAVKFRYPENKSKGSVMIFVNGVSFTNLLGSGYISYKIR